MKKVIYEQIVNKYYELVIEADNDVEIPVKNPGLMEVPEGEDVEKLPLSHFQKLIKKKGWEKISKGLINLKVWNSKKNKNLSVWADKTQEKLAKWVEDQRDEGKISESDLKAGKTDIAIPPYPADYGLVGDLTQATRLSNPYSQGKKQGPYPQSSTPKASNEPAAKDVRSQIIAAITNRIRAPITKEPDDKEVTLHRTPGT